MPCRTAHHYTICVHVMEYAAKPVVYQGRNPEDPEDDGSILCAMCEHASQRPGGWQRLIPVLRILCADCCPARSIPN